MTDLATCLPAATALRDDRDGVDDAPALASLPALFSGTVCCGSVILIAFDSRASGPLLTLFALLLPIGIACCS